MIWDNLKALFINKKLAILGFGREGTSSYHLIRRIFPENKIAIFDRNEDITLIPFLKGDLNCTIYSGKNYLENLVNYDFIIKSPGISYKEISGISFKGIISSQTDIFLSCFSSQVIGITGTKGKSTTSSLFLHILKESGYDVVFVGNIGIPPFDELDKIKDNTYIVYELSSHQLESVNHSPHISIILNIFQEHLDHYKSYDDYQKAKMNIGKFQKRDDFFIYNADNSEIVKHLNELDYKGTLLPFSSVNNVSEGCFCNEKLIEINLKNKKHYKYKTYFERKLIGQHNLMNIAVSIMACKIIGIGDDSIFNAIATFKGLPHRLEYVGCFNKKHYYNDSIATIPEAATEAVKTLDNIDTLITGGFDRGIDYQSYAEFLSHTSIRIMIFMGDAGKKVYDLLSSLKHDKTLFYFTGFDEAIIKAIAITKEDSICLLSPAAASYGMFKNFEERGKRFIELILQYA